MALKLYLREALSLRRAGDKCLHLAVSKPGTKPASTSRRLRDKYSKIESWLMRWAQEEVRERHWRARSRHRPITAVDPYPFKSAANLAGDNVTKVDRFFTSARTDFGLPQVHPQGRPERTVSDDELRSALDKQSDD